MERTGVLLGDGRHDPVNYQYDINYRFSSLFVVVVVAHCQLIDSMSDRKGRRWIGVSFPPSFLPSYPRRALISLKPG